MCWLGKPNSEGILFIGKPGSALLPVPQFSLLSRSQSLARWSMVADTVGRGIPHFVCGLWSLIPSLCASYPALLPRVPWEVRWQDSGGFPVLLRARQGSAHFPSRDLLREHCDSHLRDESNQRGVRRHCPNCCPSLLLTCPPLVHSGPSL